ncbi:MAG: hypothetical protein PF488_01890 [Patescibacteria group bacterium]|nr:hypothetical protein [Patescibacteria group bacterium]
MVSDLVCDFKNAERFFVNDPNVIYITVAFLLFNYIGCNWIRRRFTTSIPSDIDNLSKSIFNISSKSIFTILLTEKGEKIEFKENVWAKGKIFVIKPGQMFGYSKYRENKVFDFQTTITSQWKNTFICIPVIIKLKLSDMFDPIEVFDALYEKSGEINDQLGDWQKCKSEHKGVEFLYIDSYFEYLFQKINKKNQKEFDLICAKFASKKISKSYLLDNILDVVLFPERPLSNIKDVKISLKKPSKSDYKVIACKN